MSGIWALIYTTFFSYAIFAACCILMCYDKKRDLFWMKAASVCLISMIVTSIIGVALL